MVLDEVLNPPPVEIQVNGQGINGNVDIPRVIPNKYSLNFHDLRARFDTYSLKRVLLKIYDKNRKTVAVVGNVAVIIIITLILSKVLKAMCPGPGASASEEDNVVVPVGGNEIYCDRYVPVDRVVVDVDPIVASQCYSSKSCVALAESLWEKRGKLRYNFIIGRLGFVYVGHGFKCRSEERENALYVLLAVKSSHYSFTTYGDVVNRFKEILAEGLECSRISLNYTVTSKGCGRDEDWCSHYLSRMLPNRGEIGGQAYVHDDTRPAAFFNPFTIDRVYSAKSYLVECQTHLGVKELIH